MVANIIVLNNVVRELVGRQLGAAGRVRDGIRAAARPAGAGASGESLALSAVWHQRLPDFILHFTF